jgi:hypothetical protein
MNNNWKDRYKGCLFLSVLYNYRSRDSSVGIRTGYGLDDRGVGIRVPAG